MVEKLHVIKFPLLSSSSSSNNIPFFLGGEGGRGKLAERAILEWGQPNPTQLDSALLPPSLGKEKGGNGDTRQPAPRAHGFPPFEGKNFFCFQKQGLQRIFMVEWEGETRHWSKLSSIQI